MKERDSFRGTSIDDTFADSFKKSRFYKDIYFKHKEEVLIGVRDGFINMYYNLDNIAKIEVSNPNICKIDRYYTDGEKCRLKEDEIVRYFDRKKAVQGINRKNKLSKDFSLTTTIIPPLNGFA